MKDAPLALYLTKVPSGDPVGFVAQQTGRLLRQNPAPSPPADSGRGQPGRGLVCEYSHPVADFSVFL